MYFAFELLCEVAEPLPANW